MNLPDKKTQASLRAMVKAMDVVPVQGTEDGWRWIKHVVTLCDQICVLCKHDRLWHEENRPRHRFDPIV